MVHITTLLITYIYLSIKALIEALIAKETLIKVSSKYLNYASIFSTDLTINLPKHIAINNHIINLIEEKQLSYC